MMIVHDTVLIARCGSMTGNDSEPLFQANEAVVGNATP